MIALIILFLLAVLSSTQDKYDYAFSRKRSKPLEKNNEYAKAIAEYINGGKE